MECLARLKFQNRALFGFRQFGAKPSRPPSFSARAFLECFGACVCVRVARNFAYTEGGETHRLLLVEIERSGRGWGRCKTFRIIIYPLYRINNFGFVEYPPLLTFAREQSSLTYRNSWHLAIFINAVLIKGEFCLFFPPSSNIFALVKKFNTPSSTSNGVWKRL